MRLYTRIILHVLIQLEEQLEFISTISEINTLTGQKIKKNLERIVIYPATQYLTADDDKDRIIEEIKDDLRVEVKSFEDEKCSVSTCVG